MHLVAFPLLLLTHLIKAFVTPRMVAMVGGWGHGCAPPTTATLGSAPRGRIAGRLGDDEQEASHGGKLLRQQRIPPSNLPSGPPPPGAAEGGVANTAGVRPPLLG